MTVTTLDSFIHEYPGDSPSESPLVVLLHGLLTSAKYWAPARRRLVAAGYRVATIDLLGFGSAANVPTEAYGYHEHVAHVKAAIEKINGSEPVVLVGHSLGGLISMKLARHYPEMVSQLVVCNAPFYRDAAEARDTIVHTNKLYEFLMTSKFRQVGWRTATLLGWPFFSRHSARAREGALQRVIFRGMGIQDLQHVTVPTTVVTGEQDRREYLANLQQVQLNDNVELIVTPTGHHMPAKTPYYLPWIMAKLSGERYTPAQALAFSM